MILVGEMRDQETVQTAMSAAETGHLVLLDDPTPVDASRLDQLDKLDFFKRLHHHGQVRSMLAGTLKGVISAAPVRSSRTADVSRHAEVLP